MLIVSLALVSGCIQLCSTEATTPLEVIQAQVPPRTSFGDSVCQQKVFQHNFANSYGIPYVGKSNITPTFQTWLTTQESTHLQKTACILQLSSTYR